MKKTIISITLIALLTSCATAPIGFTANKKDIAKAGAVGGAVGCAIGAITAKLMGGSVATGCITSGVVAGTATALEERKKQIDEAIRLQEQAKASGLNAKVVVGEVEEVKGQGTSQQLKSLTIDLPAGIDDKVKGILVKTATMSDKSKVPVVITVFGPASQRKEIVAILKANLISNSPTKIVEANSAKASLVLTPSPKL